MLTATTQQSSVPAATIADENLQGYGDAYSSIERITALLKQERTSRNRGKEYDRVIPDYFSAIAQVLQNMKVALSAGARVAWLVGDSAPYGVYVDTPKLICQLAEYEGFRTDSDIILRRRGQRWASNTTRHDVQLSERAIILSKN
jgi:hypothetical protein